MSGRLLNRYLDRCISPQGFDGIGGGKPHLQKGILNIIITKKIFCWSYVNLVCQLHFVYFLLFVIKD